MYVYLVLCFLKQIENPRTLVELLTHWKIYLKNERKKESNYHQKAVTIRFEVDDPFASLSIMTVVPSA